MRFDEVELQSVPLPGVVDVPPHRSSVPRAENPTAPSGAPLFRRMLAAVTDLSLFVALALALSPLLPTVRSWQGIGALTGFVLLTSYYYFVGSWLLWGKTIGGAIFEVRVVADDDDAMSAGAASLRWLGLCASVVTAGIGLAMAVLPSRLSLPDRISATHCVNG
jgi:uncharacterized RDD family membrane protein YckC